MIKTQYARRIDSVGRLLIPAPLRKELDLKDDEIYDFYIHEENGKSFLCIECGSRDSEIQRAKELLERHGYKIFG